MFNAITYAAIDAVQDAKVKFVETAVQHEGIQSALISFVEAQRKYTKAAADAGLASAMSIGGIVTSKSFYEDAAEQFKSLVPQFTAKKAK